MPLRTNYLHRFSKHKRDFVTLVHEEESIPLIQDIVKFLEPKLIIELGTSWAGMTMVLNDAAPAAQLYSWDLPGRQNRVEADIVKSIPNIHICKEDILTTRSEKLTKLCLDERVKLLYCDNGNKIKEVLMYAPYLRCGDILGVHDWPNEISLDFKDLDVHHKQKNTPAEVERLKTFIESAFVPLNQSKFESNGCSTRMWRKKL